MKRFEIRDKNGDMHEVDNETRGATVRSLVCTNSGDELVRFELMEVAGYLQPSILTYDPIFDGIELVDQLDAILCRSE
jgi:hypothetical protein